MTRQQILAAAASYLETGTGNTVSADQALHPELIGLKMYDSPIMGVAGARDDYLLSLRDSPTAGLPLMPPPDWLEGAKSVISLFFPFTAQVRESNRREAPDRPSPQMMHARNEGHAFILQLCEHLREMLESAGHAAIIPQRDPRYWVAFDKPVQGHTFTTNWSERHVAFACGIGTFSLHDGIITKIGSTGRLASLITDLELPPTPRPYSSLYEYCTNCGICIASCPVEAVSTYGNKSNARCRAFLAGVQEEYKDRGYIGSCGKCQLNAPCETGAPGAI